MKRNIFYFLALMLSFSALCQKQQKVFSRYEDDSKWFIGLNAGAIWQTSDVRNKTQVGWGFLIGRSFLYNYGKPISFDVRARFLRGLWMGQDTHLTKVSPTDPAFNGSMGAYTNYLDSAKGMTLRNFQADVYEGSLELAMHINALRERTGLDVYVFGGIGLVWHQTFGNLYVVDSTGKKIYDYTTLDSYSKSASKGFLDNSFDTPLQGSYGGKRYNLDIMPSLGIGIGYQLTPMLQIGIEHKTTFTRGDLFDGKNYDDNLNPSKTKDLYHYTSLYLKINIKKAKSKRTYHPDPTTNPLDSSNISHSGPVIPPPCNKPSISIVNPRANYTSTSDRFPLSANVYGISSAAELVFKQNGIVNNNFSYNPQNNSFQSEVLLQPGSTIFEIIATNSCGQQTASRIIGYQQPLPNPSPVVYPPVITYQNPAVNPATATSATFPLQVQVLNVGQSNQITLQVNGVSHIFTYSPTTRILNASLQLVDGANTVVTTATNSAGNDSKSTVIIYRQPSTTPPPIVSFVQPNQNPQTLNNSQTTVIASVLNVENKSAITLTINGQLWNNFSFDKNTKIMQFQMNLQVGANVINIKAQNEAGQDEAATTLIYQRAEAPKPPVVQFTQPNISPITVYTPTYQLEALVENVADAQHIEVKINSVSTSNFTYNASSQTVALVTTLLNGANTISVRGVNQDGEDSKSTVIVYRGVQTNHLPTVDIISPTGNPALANAANIPIKASVEYVSQASQIKVYVNTVEINSFYYNNTTHLVEFTASIQQGDNTVRIVANNIAGQAEDSQVISYLPIVRKPPLIQYTQPTQAGGNTQNPDYTFMANVLEIDQASQLELHFNGVAVPAQNFSFSNGKISFSTPLIEGNNLIEIRATNEAGADAKSTSISYQKRQAPCNPPTLAWISPSNSLAQTNDSLLPISVQTHYIHMLNEIDLVVNGHSTLGLTLDTTTGIAVATVHLIQGINTISLVSHTACGKTLINKSISYIKPTQPCTLPTVSAVKPNILNITSQNKRFNFLASVVGVNDASQVAVKLNGVAVPFTFHLAELMVDGIVQLADGQNTLTITVSNSCGSNSITWNLNVPPCNKPAFTFGHSSSVASTTSSLYTFDGLASDVSTSSGIQLTLNGTAHNFNFNSTTGALTSILNLAIGANTIQLDLSNSCGQASFTHQINYQAPVQVSPPYVQITAPANSPSSSTTPTTELKALVQHVANPQNIRVMVNGVPTLFSYANEQLSANIILRVGANTINVTASNSGGSDSDSRVVNFTERAPILAPVVSISSPSSASETTSSSSYTVRGVVKNLSSTQGLVVYVNGRVISANTVNGRDGLDFSFPVVFDNSHSSYTIKVVASNEAGKSEQERSITHSAPVGQSISIPSGSTIIHPGTIGTPSGGRGNEAPNNNGSGTRTIEMNTRPTGQR